MMGHIGTPPGPLKGYKWAAGRGTNTFQITYNQRYIPAFSTNTFSDYFQSTLKVKSNIIDFRKKYIRKYNFKTDPEIKLSISKIFNSQTWKYITRYNANSIRKIGLLSIKFLAQIISTVKPKVRNVFELASPSFTLYHCDFWKLKFNYFRSHFHCCQQSRYINGKRNQITNLCKEKHSYTQL